MNYTILVYGLGNEGKSTWINRITTGRFLSDGNQTVNGIFATNMGNVNIKFLESNNLEARVDGIILFLDLTHHNFLNRLETMLLNIKLSHQKVPIVVCGNKSDLIDDNTLHELHQNIDTFTRSHNSNFVYYTISSVSNYNYDKPLQCLLKKLVFHNIILY